MEVVAKNHRAVEQQASDVSELLVCAPGHETKDDDRDSWQDAMGELDERLIFLVTDYCFLNEFDDDAISIDDLVIGIGRDVISSLQEIGRVLMKMEISLTKNFGENSWMLQVSNATVVTNVAYRAAMTCFGARETLDQAADDHKISSRRNFFCNVHAEIGSPFDVYVASRLDCASVNVYAYRSHDGDQIYSQVSTFSIT